MSNQLEQKNQQFSQQEWENLDSNEQVVVDISDGDAENVSGGGLIGGAIGAYTGYKLSGGNLLAAGAGAVGGHLVEKKAKTMWRPQPQSQSQSQSE